MGLLDTILDKATEVALDSDVPVIESQFSQPGQRFSAIHEVALYPLVAEAAGTVQGAQDRGLLIQEFAGPFGVADFALALLDQDSLAHRLALKMPPLLREVDAAIVSATSPRYARSPAEIAARIGRTTASVERRSRQLMQQGVLVQTDDQRIRTALNVAPVGRLHVFEAKLRDWRRAIKQARKYSLWADYCTIVLGPDTSLEIVQPAAARLGVGLVRDGRWAVRPRRTSVSDPVRLWASEHLVAALRGNVS